MTSKMVRKRTAQIHEAELLRRKKRRLIVAGSILVVATFLVKDVFRDRLKELSDTLAATEHIESEAEAKHMLLEQQNALNLAQREMQAHPAGPLKAPSKLTLQMDANFLWQGHYEASEDIENISALFDKLPQRGEGALRLRSERDDLRRELSEEQARIQKSVTENVVPSPSNMNHVSMLVLGVLVKLFQIRVILWGAEVTDAAKNTKGALDRLYGFCTWVFYLLYLAGIAVAAWGALLRIDEAPGAA